MTLSVSPHWPREGLGFRVWSMERALGMPASGKMGHLGWCGRVRKMDPGENSPDGRTSKADLNEVTRQ